MGNSVVEHNDRAGGATGVWGATASSADGCADGGDGSPNRVRVRVFRVLVSSSDITAYRSLKCG